MARKQSVWQPCIQWQWHQLNICRTVITMHPFIKVKREKHLFGMSVWVWGLIHDKPTWDLQSAWWRHQRETFSALLALCVGNLPVPGEFPPQRPVTQSFDVFFDLHLNKRLSKQWWGWWFETQSRSLWRQSNEQSTSHLTGSEMHAAETPVQFQIHSSGASMCLLSDGLINWS